MFKIIFLLTFILNFFSSYPSFATAQNPAKPPLEKIMITLGYHLDPCQIPVLLALKLGIFKKYGLDVNLSPASGGEESSRQVASKQAHIGITKSANHIVRVNKGLPLKKIGTLLGKPLEVLIVNESLPHLKELKNKKIGFSTSNPAFSLIVLDKILTTQGLTRRDIDLIAFQKGLAHAFMNGEVDAMFTATLPYDAKIAEQFNKPIRIYAYEEFGIPPFEQFIFFAHKDDEGKAYIHKFLSAMKEALALVKKNPRGVWQDICHHYPELDTSLNYKIWIGLVELFEDEPENLDLENLQKTIDFIKAHPVDGEQLIQKGFESAQAYVMLENAPSSPDNS